MTSSREVRKGASITLVSNIFEKIIVFGNVFLILSYLSVYEYGVVELVFSAVSLVGIVMLPGIGSTIQADISVARAKGEKGEMRALFLQYALFQLGVGVLAFLCMYFGAAFIAGYSGNASIQLFLQVVSFSFLLSPLRTLSLLIATVFARFFDQSLYPMVEEVAKTLGLVIGFFFLHLGPLGLLYAVLFSQAMAVLFFLPRTISGYMYFAHSYSHTHVTLHFWKIFEAHRRWSVLSGYIGMLTQNLQLWVIKLLLGTEAVGLYAFATGIMSNLSSLLPFTDVFTSLGPRYIEKKKEFIGLIQNSIRLQGIMAVLLVTVGITGLPFLTFFIPKYKPALFLSMLMLVVILPTATTAVFTPTFAILKQQVEYFKTMLIKFLLTALIMPLSILGFGIYGIAIGSILINSVSGFERYFRLRRLLPELVLKLRSLFVITRNDLQTVRQYANKVFSREALTKLLISKDS